MPIVISGTNGISGVDGTASNPSYEGTDANTGVFFPAADTVAIATGGTEALRVNSSQNVGIGTTSQNERLRLNSSNAGQARMSISYADSAISFFGSYSGIVGSGNATDVILSATNVLAFGAGGTTERMRITSAGDLLVGATAQYVDTGHIVTNTTGATFGITIRDTASTTGGMSFINSSNTRVGAIFIGASSTTYSTTSDYRLKEDVQPMAGALAKVSALKPVVYKWKSTGETDEGFIAHELAEVCPSAVTGEKDAVNEDGSIKPQGIDTSFLVATLTAAIQEQQQMIETLQAKVAALEAK
jgi:hypothetical protein